MRWFKKHKEASGTPGKDKVAKGIAGLIVKMNVGFARYMNKFTEKLSSSTLKVALIVFLSFGTSVSLYFIVAAFVKAEPLKTVKIDSISVPRNFEKTAPERVQQDFPVTEKEYQEMVRFTQYMDSLQKSEGTRYDSIMLNRPGLIDSVKVLERIYEQNKRK